MNVKKYPKDKLNIILIILCLITTIFILYYMSKAESILSKFDEKLFYVHKNSSVSMYLGLKSETEGENTYVDKIAKKFNVSILLPSEFPDWVVDIDPQLLTFSNNVFANICYHSEEYEQYINVGIKKYLDWDKDILKFSFPTEHVKYNYDYNKNGVYETLKIYHSKGLYNFAVFEIDSIIYSFTFNVDVQEFIEFLEGMELYEYSGV